MREEKRQPLHRYHQQQLHDDEESDDDNKERACRRPRIEEDEEDVFREENDEEIELNMPFCCAVCHCSQRRIRSTIRDADNDTFIVDNVSHFHRLCCHKGKPQVKAKLIMEKFEFDEDSDDDSELYAARDVRKYIQNANRQESMYFNTDDMVVEADRLMSDHEYTVKVMLDFHNQTKSKRKEGFIILDLFGGIGTAMVVLKRLKIPIKKVIHVEHDLVATFVSRMNHDFSFVDSMRKFARSKQAEGEDGGYAQLSKWEIPDDGIEHVYYRHFEEIFDTKEKGAAGQASQAFLERHVQTEGIDLVIGGPPCIDYSAVNANRQGTEGKQGQYLLSTGKLYQEIQKNQFRKVYVMIENVVISDPTELKKISDAFKFPWGPIEIDAWQMSPGRRRRNFFTNIPYSDTPEGHSYCSVTPETCMDDGFTLAQMLVRYDDHGKDVPSRRMKANTFLASQARLGDERMHVFKVQRDGDDKKRYLKRIYNVAERERIMGYAEGYVSQPVSMLFEILWYHGYARLNKYKCEIRGQAAAEWPLEKGWREMLPKELHVFAGNFLGQSFQDATPFHFQAGFPPKVLLAPPPSGKTLTYYNCKEYSMRLIGNAFSIPAVEQVLFRLKELYEPSEEQRCKELYSKWQYPYKWETPESNEIIHGETVLVEVEHSAIHGENEEDFLV